MSRFSDTVNIATNVVLEAIAKLNELWGSGNGNLQQQYDELYTNAQDLRYHAENNRHHGIKIDFEEFQRKRLRWQDISELAKKLEHAYEAGGYRVGYTV